MKYIINNNVIVGFVDEELIPKDAEIFEFNCGLNDLKIENNKIIEKTEAEKEEDRKAQERKEAKQELARTDVGMIRIIEDIIDVLDLHDKLPQAAKDKILQNRSLLREKLK